LEPNYVEMAGMGKIPVYPRAALQVGQQLDGPALITEQVSTSLVALGWCCCVDPTGVLLLNKQ